MYDYLNKSNRGAKENSDFKMTNYNKIIYYQHSGLKYWDNTTNIIHHYNAINDI